MGAIRSLREIRFLLAFAAVLSCTPPAQASPWGQPRHSLLVISRAEYFRAELAALEDSQQAGARAFTRFDTNTYAEYGLTHNTTIGGKVVYGVSTLSEPSGASSQSGFSEIEFFLQRTIHRTDRSVFAAQISAGVPSRFGSGARDSLISDGMDVEATALFGSTLATRPVKIFTAAETAYRKRTGDSADQLNAQLTFGVEPGRRWLLLADLFSTVSLRNQTPGGADFDVLKIQPAIVYRATNRMSLELGFNQEFGGRNIEEGRTVFLGLWSAF